MEGAGLPSEWKNVLVQLPELFNRRLLVTERRHDGVSRIHFRDVPVHFAERLLLADEEGL